MKILITGSAGFIGFHTAKALLERGSAVVGLDNFNAYYDPALKEARAKLLAPHKNFTMIRGDILDRKTLVHAMEGCDRVLHLARSRVCAMHSTIPMPTSIPTSGDSLM